MGGAREEKHRRGETKMKRRRVYEEGHRDAKKQKAEQKAISEKRRTGTVERCEATSETDTPATQTNKHWSEIAHTHYKT